MESEQIPDQTKETRTKARVEYRKLEVWKDPGALLLMEFYGTPFYARPSQKKVQIRLN